jgi:hypothetical protein
LAWANANAGVSVLILTGDGSAFSAGGNIKTMGERSKGPPFDLEQYYRHGVQRIPLAFGPCARGCRVSAGVVRPSIVHRRGLRRG